MSGAGPGGAPDWGTTLGRQGLRPVIRLWWYAI